MSLLTRFSLKNASAVLILCLLIVFGGIYSTSTLKKETMPNISIPIISVVTVYPGASPSDIDDKITKPLESLVSSVSGIKNINSTSSENYSAIMVEFDYSANMSEMQRKIEDSIKTAKLPDNVAAPKVSSYSMDSFPVISLSISNNKLSPDELEQKIRQNIIPAISGLDGVGQVQTASESQKAVFIKLIPSKLKEYNLTAQTVTQLLQANNVSFPAGSVVMNDTTEPVRITGKFNSIDELKNMQIPVAPDTQAVLGSTFSQMGQGMTELGKAVGQLGQGMAGMSQAYNAQLQLMSAIQDTQSKIVAAQFALNEAKQTLSNPSSTEAQKQAASAVVQQQTINIKIAQTAVEQMQAQLKQIQSKMSSAVPSASGNTAGTQKNTDTATQLQNSQGLKQVSLSEIAEITVGTDDSTSFSRTNGNPSVVLDIIKTQESNTIDVCDSVRNKVDSLKSTLPGGSEVVPVFNQADSVKESINGILREGLLGAVFAFLIILLFLRNFRTTIIACISIPLSILITLIFLKQLNITLNILTLGGLSVAVGRIVDDSIVVIENTYRHLQSEEIKTVDMIKLGTKEVASAITSSTLTTVAVFVPIALVSGLAGVMFKPFAITVGLALLSSLLVAVTVIPVMSRFLLLRTRKVKHSDFHEGKLMKRYQKLLTWSLNHKAIALLVAFLLFIGSLSLLPFIGTSFMPEQKENNINITFDYPAGTDVKVVNDKAIQIEKMLSDDKDVSLYQTTVGSDSSNPMSRTGSSSGSIMIQLKENSNIDGFIKKYKAEVAKDPEKAEFSITQTSQDNDGANNIEVNITGSDFSKVTKTAQTLTKDLQSVKGLEQVSNNLAESKPEISISVDQKKASEKALSAAQAGMTVSSLLNSSTATTMLVDKNTMDVRVGLKLDSISKLDDIKGIELQSPTGETVKISDIADVREVPGAVSIYKKDGKECAKVTGVITDKSTGTVSAKVQNIVNKMKLPEGVSINMGGVSEMMNDSFSQIGVAMIVAILVVFFVMLVALGEAAAALAILFSLPLAVIGGLIALFITRVPLDMPAMIGALMLIGIVVTNAIVFVDRVQHKRKEGMSVREALLEAGTIRMRPILMTAIATMAALMPLALGISKGSVMSQSLAVIVIGGLATSTFLTLIIVPVAYEMLNNLKRRIFNRKEKTTANA
ncbi:MAG: efflux RND transporter permease subunit [Bacillota bacterium]|nr:efflux RND transporter permease subunit [Bacillota bacterium]